VLHRNYVFLRWIELSSFGYHMYSLQERGALWVTDDELLRNEGLAAYVPLQDKGAQEDLFSPEILVALNTYDPEAEIVVVFQDDEGELTAYTFHALTPPEAKSFVDNDLLPGGSYVVFSDEDSDDE
jgi:hypothetical protein